jgi:C_GCAxxG_C_C family probable redox protein
VSAAGPAGARPATVDGNKVNNPGNTLAVSPLRVIPAVPVADALLRLRRSCATIAAGLEVQSMNRIERAVSCFNQGFSCSQAVLSTFGPELGLSRELALKVAGAFGGGMAGMGDTCGAVTGALMVIGLRYGRTRVEDEAAKKRSYSLAREFADRFKSRNGSTVCRDLLGCDISTPEGKEIAEQRELHTTHCPKFVQDATEIIEQILEEGA